MCVWMSHFLSHPGIDVQDLFLTVIEQLTKSKWLLQSRKIIKNPLIEASQLPRLPHCTRTRLHTGALTATCAESPRGRSAVLPRAKHSDEHICRVWFPDSGAALQAGPNTGSPSRLPPYFGQTNRVEAFYPVPSQTLLWILPTPVPAATAPSHCDNKQDRNYILICSLIGRQRGHHCVERLARWRNERWEARTLLHNYTVQWVIKSNTAEAADIAVTFCVCSI